MNEYSGLETLRKEGLLPHQAYFGLNFLKADAAPYHVLVAPPGSGRLETVTVITSRLIAEQETERVLALTSRDVLQDAFVRAFAEHSEKLPVIAVNRATYRELEARVDVGANPWERPIIAVMRAQLATQRSVRESLLGVTWDLVVADEVHELGEEALALLQEMLQRKGTRRLLVLTSQTSEVKLDFAPAEVAVTQWSRDLVDWEGKPLFSSPRLEKRLVSYSRNEEEREFLRQLTVLMDGFAETRLADLQRRLLLQRASSSIYALERSLRRLRNYLVHGPPPTLLNVFTEEDLDERDEVVVGEASDLQPEWQWKDIKLSPPMIMKLLYRLDTLPIDTKLNALMTLLQEIDSLEWPVRVSIFSRFADTVSYLHTALSDAGVDAHQVTASTPYDERNEIFKQFSESGGVLIASTAGLQGLEDIRATVVIHYDLSLNPQEADMRLSQINLPADAKTLTVYAFRDVSETLAMEVEALRLHGFDVMSDADEVQ